MANYVQGHVELIKAPQDLRELMQLRKALNLDVSVAQFREMVKHLPCTVIDKITDVQFTQLLFSTGLQGYLLFIGERHIDTSFAAWCAHKGAAELREQGGPTSPSTQPEIIDPQPLYWVALQLSDNDVDVMREMKFAGGQAAAEYFAARKEQFAQRGIETMSQLAAFSSGQIWQLGLADVLINQQYACELDWKEEIEEAVWAVAQLKLVMANKLPVDNCDLFEDDEISLWLERLNAKWQPLGFYLADLGLDSDSYVLVPCRLAQLPMLQQMTEQCGFKIY